MDARDLLVPLERNVAFGHPAPHHHGAGFRQGDDVLSPQPVLVEQERPAQPLRLDARLQVSGRGGVWADRRAVVVHQNSSTLVTVPGFRSATQIEPPPERMATGSLMCRGLPSTFAVTLSSRISFPPARSAT